VTEYKCPACIDPPPMNSMEQYMFACPQCGSILIIRTTIYRSWLKVEKTDKDLEEEEESMPGLGALFG